MVDFIHTLCLSLQALVLRFSGRRRYSISADVAGYGVLRSDRTAWLPWLCLLGREFLCDLIRAPRVCPLQRSHACSSDHEKRVADDGSLCSSCATTLQASNLEKHEQCRTELLDG